MIIYKPEDSKALFKLKFDDLGEVFLCAVLLAKLPDENSGDALSLTLSMDDIYFSSALSEAKDPFEVKVPSKDQLAKDFESFFSLQLGFDVSQLFGGRDASEFKVESFSKYFGDFLKRTLEYLKSGDSCGTKPTIESYEKIGDDPMGTPIFRVELLRSKFLENFKYNLIDYIKLGESAYPKFLSITEGSSPIITVDKQLEFLRAHLDKRSSVTGETQFSFLLSHVNFRRAMITIQGPGGNALMPSPLSSGAGVKAALPFLLAVQGEIDIVQVKISSPIERIDDIEIQFSVRRPAVKNVFGASYCALPPDTRARMTGVEIEAYEKIVKSLQLNLCFHNNPKMESDFSLFTSWILKQVAYCLEEPSFLKHRSAEWLKTHQSQNYKRMEDDFFLPFLYERMREKFGNLISKKPERFGGNVDILFGDIPIELKVRKGHRDALVDKVVDEKYKPTSQAAAYAALTRLGCVLVLDIPTTEPAVTNITSCIKVVTRYFPEAELPTSIPVFIFQCNTPKPSSAN